MHLIEQLPQGTRDLDRALWLLGDNILLCKDHVMLTLIQYLGLCQRFLTLPEILILSMDHINKHFNLFLSLQEQRNLRPGRVTPEELEL